MSDSVKEKYARMRKVIHLERPDRIPTPADWTRVEYRVEVYHQGENIPVAEGEVKVTGKVKTTADGGNWVCGDRDKYTDYEDVLNADPAEFEVESVSPAMLAEMTEKYKARAGERYVAPLHYGTLYTRATLEFDWEPFLLASAMDAIKLGKILDRFGEASLAVVKGWCELDDVELLTIHDDIAATRGLMMSPDWYREYVFPWYRELFNAVHAKGKKVVYISDGNYFQAIDDILDTGPDGLFIESSSLDPAEVMNAGGNKLIYHLKTDNRNVEVGTPETIREEVKKIRELNEQYPAIFMYRGGSDRNRRNVEAFEKCYQELLVYG